MGEVTYYNDCYSVQQWLCQPEYLSDDEMEENNLLNLLDGYLESEEETLF